MYVGHAKFQVPSECANTRKVSAVQRSLHFIFWTLVRDFTTLLALERNIGICIIFDLTIRQLQKQKQDLGKHDFS